MRNPHSNLDGLTPHNQFSLYYFKDNRTFRSCAFIDNNVGEPHDNYLMNRNGYARKEKHFSIGFRIFWTQI